MQPSLLDSPIHVPQGFEYQPAIVSETEEQRLVDAITRIEFSSVEMRGAVARRRTAHFGWTYGYESRSSQPGKPIPQFLLELRERVAGWMGVAGGQLGEALITEYPPGAPIGWHRDAPMFGDVAGVSLVSACRMKFRPYASPAQLRSAGPPRRTTHEIELEPRSGYLIRGVARREYEHHIPAVRRLRYSVTFRTLRTGSNAVTP